MVDFSFGVGGRVGEQGHGFTKNMQKMHKKLVNFQNLAQKLTI